jgi:hypothetical protein
MRRHLLRQLALGATLGAVPTSLHAQDRLIGSRVLGVGGTADVVQFGSVGYQQPGIAGRDSVLLRRIEQYSVPISVVVPIGANWTFDVQSAFSYVRLTTSPKLGTAGPESQLTLYGPTDVRMRATGRLLGDALILTAGFNAPSGQTSLGSSALTVLRAQAAPALGMSAAPVGAGPSGTAGLVVARELLGWGVAIGASYEARGVYQPVAALTAGAPAFDFVPGDVLRGSIGIDRVVGRHRINATAAVDMYADDRLRDPATALLTGNTIRLGPIFTSDAQLQLGVNGFREFVLWGTNRFRTRFERDGVQVAGTSGNYLDGGLRLRVPLSAANDLLLTGDGRWHTGLAISQGIATSGVRSGGGTIGLISRVGAFSIQPYIRGQGGQLRPRIAGSAPRTAFWGGSAGLILVSTF